MTDLISVAIRNPYDEFIVRQSGRDNRAIKSIDICYDCRICKDMVAPLDAQSQRITQVDDTVMRVCIKIRVAAREAYRILADESLKARMVVPLLRRFVRLCATSDPPAN